MATLCHVLQDCSGRGQKSRSTQPTSCRSHLNFCEPSYYFTVATYLTRQIYSGLFSAAVAALLAMTIPDLKPNSPDTSEFYMENIYELFANPNSSNASIPSTLANPLAPSPPRYAIWCAHSGYWPCSSVSQAPRRRR